MKRITHLIAVIILLNWGNTAWAQLYKVSIDEKVTNATLIVEAKVIAQNSFWNSAHTLIYTSNTLELYKSFKGQLPPGTTTGTIEVLTQGGVVGNDFIEVSDLVKLSIGDKGVFFLYPNTISLLSPVNGRLLYDIYSSDQGVLRYSFIQNKTICPFEEYSGITTNFYSMLQSLTGMPYEVLNAQYSVDAEVSECQVPRQQSATINSTSPAIVNAGAILSQANNVLTIIGAGFGNNTSGGKALLFKDASNDLTYPSLVIPFNSPYIISWENTEIKVRIPARAANGRFAVYLGVGDTADAPQPLRVNYSVWDVVFNPAFGPQEVRLGSTNGMGGYNIVYSTSTGGNGVNIITSPVYNTFKRALATWKETAGVHFTETGTTSSQTVNANDGQNIIMLDNTNTGQPVLPAGILAVTYNGYNVCPSPGDLFAPKTGFDIVIRNPAISAGTIAFENGPCPPAFLPLPPNQQPVDLETVLLHELGHGLNLGHVYEPAKLPAPPFNFANYRTPAALMHYTSGTWDVRRTPDASAYNASLYTITPRGISAGLCPPTVGEMVPLATNVLVPANDNCPLVFPTTPTPMGTIYDIDLAHATCNQAADPQPTNISCTQPVSVTNNVYQAIRTNQGGGLIMNISNYTTIPAELGATCDSNQGVRLAVYNVNTCPAGQAFPPPVACYTISGNGTLPMLSGLAANKTYLMFFEGVRNTKAKFAIALTGAALPIKLISFTGKNVNSSTNTLSATIAEAVNVLSVEVERSADSRDFTSIGQLSKIGSSFNGLHNFTDAKALNGTSYYRLKTTDVDSKVEYSNIIALTTAGKIAISLQPNPFNTFITIKAQDGRSKLTAVISDVVLKKVKQTTFSGSIQIPTSLLAKGTYFISVYDANGQLLNTSKMLKE